MTCESAFGVASLQRLVDDGAGCEPVGRGNIAEGVVQNAVQWARAIVLMNFC
jgi:hypothetical protein